MERPKYQPPELSKVFTDEFKELILEEKMIRLKNQILYAHSLDDNALNAFLQGEGAIVIEYDFNKSFGLGLVNPDETEEILISVFDAAITERADIASIEIEEDAQLVYERLDSSKHPTAVRLRIAVRTEE